MPLLAPDRYDRRASLGPAERGALRALVERQMRRLPRDRAPALARLLAPVDDVLAPVAPRAQWWGLSPARGALIAAMDREQRAFWGFGREQWARVIAQADPDVRQLVMAVAYLLCGQRDQHLQIRGFKRGLFARRDFGAGPVERSIARVQEHLDGFGHATRLGRPAMLGSLFELMLGAGSPQLEDLALDPGAFVALHARARSHMRFGVGQLAVALHAMGLLERVPFPSRTSDQQWLARTAAPGQGTVPPQWTRWVARWFVTSTLSRRTREAYFYTLLKTTSYRSTDGGASHRRPLARLMLGVHQGWLEHVMAQAAVGEASAADGNARFAGTVEVTLLFCDLIHFTRLISRHGELAAARTAAEFAQVVRASADEDGCLVKELGDGALVAYSGPAAAVRAWMQIVASARERSLPPLHGAVHHGEAVFRGGDYFGAAVNLTARLVGRAPRGELFATESVVQATSGQFDWRARGRRRLAGIPDTVPLFSLVQRASRRRPPEGQELVPLPR